MTTDPSQKQSSSRSKRCLECNATIAINAKKCRYCREFQDRRRYVDLLFRLLPAIVAVLSLSTLFATSVEKIVWSRYPNLVVTIMPNAETDIVAPSGWTDGEVFKATIKDILYKPKLRFTNAGDATAYVTKICLHATITQENREEGQENVKDELASCDDITDQELILQPGQFRIVTPELSLMAARFPKTIEKRGDNPYSSIGPVNIIGRFEIEYLTQHDEPSSKGLDVELNEVFFTVPPGE